jgi:hypothetical protein
MNLPWDVRRGVETLPVVLEAMIARINTIWGKQHDPQTGGHRDITAQSVSAKTFFNADQTTPMGHGIMEPYDSSAYTASSGLTWTVPAGAVKTNRYMLGPGNYVAWSVEIVNAAIAGTGKELRIRLPGGKLPASNWFGAPAFVLDGSDVAAWAGISIMTGTNYASVFMMDNSDWVVGGGNWLWFSLVFEAA